MLVFELSNPMPHFFLHIRNGDEWTEDPEGIDFPDVELARKEALEAARELLGEGLKHGLSVGHVLQQRVIEICDDSGHVLDAVALREAISWQ